MSFGINTGFSGKDLFWTGVLRYIDPDGHDDVAAAGCLWNGGCLQELADKRRAAVEKAADVASSPITIGLAELGAAYLTGGAALEATTAWKAATGTVAASGLFVRGSTRIIAAATEQDQKQVEKGITAVAAVTNPAGLAVTTVTGDTKAGAMVANAVSTAKALKDPSKAATVPVRTGLTLRGFTNTLKTLFTPVAPPTPPPPPPAPRCTSGGTTCQ